LLPAPAEDRVGVLLSGVGHVLLTILAGAGLRISEVLTLRWSQVDLATGALHVLDSKTDAAMRLVDLTPPLREELVLWRATSRHTEPDNYVLTTSTGRKQRIRRICAGTCSDPRSSQPTRSSRQTASHCVNRTSSAKRKRMPEAC
jgi:integrase